jgi:hypothetical protein
MPSLHKKPGLSLPKPLSFPNLLSGILLIGLLRWGLSNPEVRWRFARKLAMTAMGLGTRFVGWDITGALSGEHLRAPSGNNIV